MMTDRLEAYIKRGLGVSTFGWANQQHFHSPCHQWFGRGMKKPHPFLAGLLINASVLSAHRPMARQRQSSKVASC